jgi:hypothetical protein
MAGRRHINEGMNAVAKRRSKGAPQPERSPHKNLNVRIDAQIYAAFEAWMESQKVMPTTTNAVAHALAEFLRSQGFDPAHYAAKEEHEK